LPNCGFLFRKWWTGEALLIRLGSFNILVLITFGGGPTISLVLRLDSEDPNLTGDDLDKLVDK
jgi:hypothetical protein